MSGGGGLHNERGVWFEALNLLQVRSGENLPAALALSAEEPAVVGGAVRLAVVLDERGAVTEGRAALAADEALQVPLHVHRPDYAAGEIRRWGARVRRGGPGAQAEATAAVRAADQGAVARRIAAMVVVHHSVS